MHPARPRISVITPCLNDGSCLEPTLCSVLDQDYNNWEYLVADGGSTDGTEFALAKYDRRIAWWCSEPDRGRSDAIHKALRRSIGDLVLILDAGDVLLPDTMNRIASCAQRHGAAWIIGRAQAMDNRLMMVGQADRAFHVWRQPLMNVASLVRPDLAMRFEKMMTMHMMRTGHRPAPLAGIAVAKRQKLLLRQAA